MPDEPVILLNLLKVEAEKQGALIALLRENIDSVVSTLPGWRASRLIAGGDGTSVAIYSEWQTPAAVEAMRRDPRMLACFPRIRALASFEVGPGSDRAQRAQAMTDEEFEDVLKAMRPRLHRYCARMTGSAVDGEDVLQDTLVKALRARADGAEIDSPEAWLFRIAHNTSLDLLRRRARHAVVPLTEGPEPAALPTSDILAVSFHTFLQLPELQRCAVILKDVLGHSVEEIAEIADTTPAAAKSALQRGRVALRKLAGMPEDTRLPLMPEADRQRMAAYVDLFRSGDFDAIRAMLADEVRLELVNRVRLAGREKVDVYFTRYAEETKWRFALGAIEGRPAMLAFDRAAATGKPAHFVLIDWHGDRIAAIRDFLFAPYVLEADRVGAARLSPPAASQALPDLDRLGEDHLLALPHRRVEADRPPGVAGRAGLLDDQKQAVAVAVDAQLHQPLHVARGRALAPELARASATSR